MRVQLSIVLAIVFVATCSYVMAADFAQESYQIAESQRLDQIARQLDLNYRMIWQAGFGPRYPNPFEPWPRVTGDIWGYPSPRPIEHPVGYESAQTGPNRWIYRPIYAVEALKEASKSGLGTTAGLSSSARRERTMPTEKPAGPGGNDWRRRAIAPPKPQPSDLDAAEPRPQPGGPREF